MRPKEALQELRLRKDILQLLGILSCKCPELRITQIIGNALPGVSDPYHVSDFQLESALRDYLSKI